ncbi:hypothetical protein LCGC14_0468570 [marine sediment metagenome]|uniref:Major capsid protein n=1 Tax=marine sediment metagenome TaxID=412755 RepID=A0A0F9UZP8_9ZZZZ
MQLANGVHIDTIHADRGGLHASSNVANVLLGNGFNVNALRTNATLRKEEWLQFDTKLIEVARQRLPLVTALIAAGLSFNISDGLGTTILEWEQVSDMEPADVSMDGVSRGEQDILEFTLLSMPLPIIHKDFTINVRKLHASRRLGQPLDTAQAALAGRLVAETTESMVILGHATRVGAAQIFGLTTEGNRSTGAQSADWDSAATGDQILTDVLAMIADAQGDDMYGPYVLLVNYPSWNNMMEDFKAASDKTTMQRIKEIPDISNIIPSKDVPASESIMLQMTSDVIDEVVGLQPTTVQWETQGGMMLHFKVMSIMIPRVRSTVTGQSGIVHYS